MANGNIDLVIPEEGLLKEELQEEIKERFLATVENLAVLEVEIGVFIELVKQSVEDNKDNLDDLQTIYDSLDEIWGVVVTKELRDVLLNSLCIVQSNKPVLEDIMEGLEETLEIEEILEE
jgi:hypothetical protein